VFNGVISAFETAINFAVRGLNGLIRAANKVPFVDIPQISEISIPRLAKGGIVTSPTLALIGEAGPEAVVPLSGRNAQQAGLALGGGPAVNIEKAVFQNGTDAQLVAQKVNVALTAWRLAS
jgi:hypothetical protein